LDALLRVDRLFEGNSWQWIPQHVLYPEHQACRSVLFQFLGKLVAKNRPELCTSFVPYLCRSCETGVTALLLNHDLN